MIMAVPVALPTALGFSLLRSVRWATSAAYDAYGRTRAAASATEVNERVMVAELPVAHVATVYNAVGDAPVVVACAASLLVLLVRALVRSSPRRPKSRGSPKQHLGSAAASSAAL